MAEGGITAILTVFRGWLLGKTAHQKRKLRDSTSFNGLILDTEWRRMVNLAGPRNGTENWANWYEKMDCVFKFQRGKEIARQDDEAMYRIVIFKLDFAPCRLPLT